MNLMSILASLGSDLKKWPEIYLILLWFVVVLRYLYVKHIKNKVMVIWPIVDMLPSLILNAHRIHDWTVDISNTKGGTQIFRGPIFGRLNMLFTCDPSNIDYILRTNSSNFPKGSEYKETFDILGDGLFNTDFDLWHAQRTMARMTFTTKKVRFNIANKSQKVVKDSLIPFLAHNAKESLVVDLEDVFLRYTFDSSFAIIFGRNPNYLSNNFPRNEFAESMDDATDVLFHRHVVPLSWWKLCRWLNIGDEKKMDRAWKTIDKYLEEYIMEKKDMPKEAEATDLLQVYMNLKGGKNEEILSSDKFFRDTALTFLFAGRDTTASALTWFFWLVSKNPRVETKLVEELKLVALKKTKDKSVLKTKRSWVFDSDDLTEMNYLHAALYETLRLYPSLPLNRKGSLREDVLPDGTVVKPGMMIIISKYATARMEWVWGKDCLEFKPERWMEPDGKLNYETMSKLHAFSIGPRICIGKDMAFVMMKLAASAMLFNFHIEVLEGQDIQPKPSIVLQMKNGLMVRIKKRIL